MAATVGSRPRSHKMVKTGSVSALNAASVSRCSQSCRSRAFHSSKARELLIVLRKDYNSGFRSVGTGHLESQTHQHRKESGPPSPERSRFSKSRLACERLLSRTVQRNAEVINATAVVKDGPMWLRCFRRHENRPDLAAGAETLTYSLLEIMIADPVQKGIRVKAVTKHALPSVCQKSCRLALHFA